MWWVSRLWAVFYDVPSEMCRVLGSPISKMKCLFCPYSVAAHAAIVGGAKGKIMHHVPK